VKLMNEKYENGMTVDGEQINLTGMVVGTLHVGKDGYVQLHGTVTKDLTVSELGIVKLHGTVIGDVYNLGGVIEVFGTVKGKVHHKSGRITYFTGAMVDGERIPSDRSVGAAIIDR
jgi:cytoskeletal protein CcmA (bactofilin family)